MANLSQIALVQIDLKTAAVPSAVFGIPMVTGPTIFKERVRSYTSMDAVSADGTLSPEVKEMIRTTFAQTPRPVLVKVGRSQVKSVSLKVMDDFRVVASATFSVTVGTTAPYIVTGKADAASVMTALATAMAADTAVTAAANGDVLTLTYKSGKTDAIMISGNMQVSASTTAGTAESVKADLSAIALEDSEWYVLLNPSRDAAVIEACADWTEAEGSVEQPRIYVIASGDSGIAEKTTTADIASKLKAKSLLRTALFYDPLASTQYMDAAIVGTMVTKEAGSATWSLKTIRGVTASRISATAQSAAWSKNANTFEPYANDASLALTNHGNMVGGEWIDIVIGRDWLANRIQRDQVQLMINRDKIPYNNSGIAAHESTLRGSLVAAQARGIIATDEMGSDGKNIPGFRISAPNSYEVSDSDKAARKLNMTFAARITGAVHLVEVRGSLAYSI